MMKAAEQKITSDHVGNRRDLLRRITYLGNKDRSSYAYEQPQSDLLAAILKRKTCDIQSIVEGTGHASVSEDLYKIMQHTYGPLLEKPILLAMKLASNDTTEATKGDEPTRLDVLHCLATHFDALVESARKQGRPIPDLLEILNFGRDFKTAIPLHTFILGLPEHRKEEAAEILNVHLK